MKSEKLFLEDEIQRKLFELGASETERKINIAKADVMFNNLTTDINVLQKRLMELGGSK
jgi:hypothetical protein